MTFSLVLGFLAIPALGGAANGYCDTTLAERNAARANVAAAMAPLGYKAVTGNYTCQTGTSGASNPESVSCFYDLGNKLKLPVFQLEETDVLVYIGCAPRAPGPLYWGFSPYLMAFNALNLLTMRPGGQLVDSVNQYLLNTTASAGASGPWGGSYAIVATPDAVSNQDAGRALAKSGIVPDAVNLVNLPTEFLNLGTRPRDSFVLLGSRAGPFHSKADKAAYIKAVSGEQVQLFRLRRTKSRPASPLPTPTFDFYRPSKLTETVLADKLKQTVASAQQWAVSAGWRLTRRTDFHVQTRDGKWTNGTECNTNRSTLGCAMDTTDAAYFDSGVFPTLKPNNKTMDIVLGVNTAKFGKASYSSLALYVMKLAGGQNGVVGGTAVSSLKYGGSALRFNPEAPELFAVTVRAGCGASEVEEGTCLEMPLGGAAMLYVTRAYADPVHFHAPDPAQLLAPVVLRFEQD